MGGPGLWGVLSWAARLLVAPKFRLKKEKCFKHKLSGAGAAGCTDDCVPCSHQVSSRWRAERVPGDWGLAGEERERVTGEVPLWVRWGTGLSDYARCREGLYF